MKTGIIAGILAAALTTGAVAAFTDRAAPVFAHTPTRPYVVLGTVTVLTDSRPAGLGWAEAHGDLLLAEARSLHARPSAVIAVRHSPLPNGDGAVSTGVAVAWAPRSSGATD